MKINRARHKASAAPALLVRLATDRISRHSARVCEANSAISSAKQSSRLARRGKRVLCLTIDPAKRLAESLGISEMSRSW